MVSWGVSAVRVYALLFLSSAAQAAEAPPSLVGTWTSPALRISIDEKLVTANVDDGMWQPFAVQDVSGQSIMFSIGEEQFFGILRNESLTVTHSSDRTSRTLRRSYLRSTFRQ